MFSNPLTRLAATCGILWSLTAPARANVGAWGPGMYCGQGNVVGVDDENTNAAVEPMHDMTRAEWWFHAYNGCLDFPPPPGEFLELPANGKVKLELAVNRKFTTRANNPILGLFPHGEDTLTSISEEGCVVNPNIHTRSEEEATGSVLAISYATSFERVKPENLVVFSVRHHTPWYREVEYDVPNLPKCPPNGCFCAWGWLPDDCGQPTMSMQAFRCTVLNPPTSAAVHVGRARPPVWCEEDPSTCRQGAKQMIFWTQTEGNNVVVEGLDLEGRPKRPVYDGRMGFSDGAQHDIFL
ncbi:hypothetical protein CC1G_08018 [Coprinopsis cinerea okayama7|uniref:Uncharacterized protein n=1 Tax=Coprinopsis cinerea (strain Okayama-7 / 130 / ATCC MYA-4618 / FGSC 9003) TaxID=240176 RepID=A8NQA1_COPC7|nr:hypothetical protein CC1G_08018 [Coprinopsis cinerea okayama7\|eukprot:XP_001835509.1 hypothetical protein CC1G_08018 [Coprinopsis cinerea okayama7\